MTGPKRNEGATLVGERTGTRATARYVRFSAYKAREVLNLIRGLDVRAADETLQFTERNAAVSVRKVLASAVANAVNNDELDADELYVRACFADEGPTLKRFRPRARGRASRIRKRTTHITVVVDVMTDAMRARRDAKEAARPDAGRRTPSSAAAARRARVERSRAAAAAAKDEGSKDETTGEEALVDGPHGPGSAAPLEDGSAPDGFTIKGNQDSMLYHTPDSPHYARTVAEVWFTTEEAAQAAGFAMPAGQAAKEAELDDSQATDIEDDASSDEGAN